MRNREIIGGILIAAAAIAGFAPTASAQATLDPLTIPQFVDPLTIPQTMPKTPNMAIPKIDYYEIAVRQFQQQILPTKGFGSSGKDPFPKTTVWGYGSINHPTTFSYPSYTIEAQVDKPVRVKWINDLKDPLTGNYLSHLLPVDQTLHWANPPMECREGAPRTDCGGKNQTPYTGPVPIVTHLHGAHVGPDSDGFPTAWYLPAANNIPAGYATKGSNFGQIPGMPAQPGAAVFQYPNDQRATTLWFHDHTIGMTRTNVYAGPAGFYLLRGGCADLSTGTLPSGKYEIPLVIQDRAFKTDGSLFYPDNRAYFEGLPPDQLQIPFTPDSANGGISDVAPIWNPEFFGDTIVVNGKTWPYTTVEPRKYRLRILNASDSRFFILTTGGKNPLPFWQIGADGGFLPAPVKQTKLLIGPAERADVIVDFSAYKPGTTITLLNVGPDEPFGGGVPGVDFISANPKTTGKVLQFRVVALASTDNSTAPANLKLPARTPLGSTNKTRKVSLNEEESATVTYIVDNGNFIYDTSSAAVPFGPTEAALGTLDSTGNPVVKEFMDPITENPALNSTEIWEIYNFTADAHPIHIHLVQFEVLNRQKLATDADGISLKPAQLIAGTKRSPELWETGTKDTVVVYPGELARVKAKFDMSGLFAWHCHILSHEDNEMMRPYYVGPIPPGM